ncbi:MAG: alpha/beta hydrolase [Isosphaeraceae bacterium]
MIGCVRGALATSLLCLGIGMNLLGPSAARGASQEETWEGSLKVGQVSLRLVFNVVKAEDGRLSATMDSPDQGATGLKVDTVTITPDRVQFELKALFAKFEGRPNKAGNEAEGQWIQGGQTFPLTLKKVATPKAAPAAAGKEQIWEGKIAIGAGLQLRMVLRVKKAPDGSLSAVADSPDQGAKGLKVDSVEITKEKLSYTMKAIGGSFEGKLDPSGTVATGEWSQSGQKLPLTLKQTTKASETRRPQTPKPPFPYISEDVTYENKAGKIKLAGTLTRPRGEGPFPAVILISGSGAQDRDETIFEHRPFAVLADALTRRGVAVLRVDDRGVGGSQGDPAKATSEDFASDVAAGVAYLRSRPEIRKDRIGLMGHSEGGVIAPMVAAKSNDVAFIVLLAGTGLPGDQILQLQGRLIALSLGVESSLVDAQLKVQKKLIEVVLGEPDDAKAEAKMKAVVKEMMPTLPEDLKKSIKAVEASLDGQLKMLRSPWFRYFLSYDPRPTLRKVKCPVLAVIGEKDLQVPPRENLAEIEKALKAGGNAKVTVKQLAGLNHLLQTAKSGSTTEYAQIEETVSPVALKEIGDWVVETTGAKP